MPGGLYPDCAAPGHCLRRQPYMAEESEESRAYTCGYNDVVADLIGRKPTKDHKPMSTHVINHPSADSGSDTDGDSDDTDDELEDLEEGYDMGICSSSDIESFCSSKIPASSITRGSNNDVECDERLHTSIPISPRTWEFNDLASVLPVSDRSDEMAWYEQSRRDVEAAKWREEAEERSNRAKFNCLNSAIRRFLDLTGRMERQTSDMKQASCDLTFDQMDTMNRIVPAWEQLHRYSAGYVLSYGKPIYDGSGEGWSNTY